MNSSRCVLVLAAALVIGRAPLAADQALGAKTLADELRHCAATGGDAERLACYDQLASKSPPQAEIRPEPRPSAVPVPSPAPPAAEFGVNNGPLQAKQQAGKPRAITAVVTKIAQRPRGELVMTLDNGQVWVQNDAAAYFPLKPGDKVEISVGMLDSYVLWAPFRRSTKVTRIN
ncbi:MAG: hypothetical protein ABSG18_18905 [Steroidobacteraceae bacterium]